MRSRFIEPYTEIRVNEKGEQYTATISVEDQIAQLSKEWKPVDPIDVEKMKTESGKVVILQPYDAGDHISYNYIEKEDIQSVRQEIATLKQELADTDYQVIKCYEASLLQQAMPYDVQTLVASRQMARIRINELEELL